jgi:hypothetical protein
MSGGVVACALLLICRFKISVFEAFQVPFGRHGLGLNIHSWLVYRPNS